MSDAHSELGSRALHKVAWRLIPFMTLLYFVAFLDRVNIGFAALTMNADLGLTPRMFGFASGIFFIGYVMFEVPSNIIMERVGARLWIARIMITWGLLSAGTAFVSTPTSLYVLRFLLGVAEAGFFPGMILYLTYWFPAAWRARILSAFMVALPISNVIGSPVSTALLSVEAQGSARLAMDVPHRRHTGSAVRFRGAAVHARWTSESAVAHGRRKAVAAEPSSLASTQPMARLRIRAFQRCARRACGSSG